MTPSPELIEHVAEAIWRHRTYRDHVEWPELFPDDRPTWEEASDAVRSSVRNEARAVLEYLALCGLLREENRA